MPPSLNVYNGLTSPADAACQSSVQDVQTVSVMGMISRALISPLLYAAPEALFLPCPSRKEPEADLK